MEGEKDETEEMRLGPAAARPSLILNLAVKG